MKATTFLIAACLMLVTCLQAFSKEYPMPAPGATWGFVDPDYPNYRAYIDSYTPKDTIINNITYSRYLTRYDSRRVYQYDSDLKGEYILYDFNLNEGDSLYIRGFDTKDSILLLIDGTTNITVKNGEVRKYMILRTKELYGRDYWRYTWVEGLGDLDGGFYYTPPGMFVETFGLICYCDTSGLVYQKWAGVTCDNILQLYPSSAAESAAENVFAFIDNERILHISSERMLRSVTLTDASGRTVLKQKDKSMNLSDVTTGIYALSVSLEDGSVYSTSIAVP